MFISMSTTMSFLTESRFISLHDDILQDKVSLKRLVQRLRRLQLSFQDFETEEQ